VASRQPGAFIGFLERIGGAGGGGKEKLARKRLGGAGLEEAEVNERGARLPRRETRPAAAALERGKMAPSGG